MSATASTQLPCVNPLEVVYRPIEELTPHKRNARTHSKKQVRQIADSMTRFGVVTPLLVTPEHRIIAGHGRLEAAKLLDIDRVPTICIDHLTEAEIRAYTIADNRLAENAGWDHELLALEFEYIAELDIDLDLTLTGFETPEIDLIIGELYLEAERDPEDDVPELDDSKPVIARAGDLLSLGAHRLLCGDARDPADYSRLMGDERAEMLITDPPYNVPIAGHVSGLGKVKHEEFQMASGEMSRDEFVSFLKEVFVNLVAYSVDGSIHYIFMDWRHMAEILDAGGATYSEFKNLCVWNKTNGGMGSLYRSKHELVFVFKHGTAPHINNIELGKHGRYRTNVWDYAGVNTMREGRMDELAMHPTVKPIALFADAILDCSHRNGIVLDPFLGSGTTIMAAERTGRRCYAMEIDPRYVDVAIRRWEKVTGENARLVDGGATFAELTAQRAKEVEHA